MAWASSGRTNEDLVENMWNNGLITEKRVKEAFLKVDRAHFAPSSPYQDSPQPIGYDATISAPHMHAHAMEHLLAQLSPPPSSTSSSSASPRRVLDVGSGSGYLTLLMAEIAGQGAKVVGLEHIPQLRQLGEDNVKRSELGREFLREGRVRFRVGDGRKGWEEVEGRGEEGEGEGEGERIGGAGGWDVIHVGASARVLHPELVEQLRPGGRMFIPVDDEGGWGDQSVWVVDKAEDGTVEKKRLIGVRYVPLTDAKTFA